MATTNTDAFPVNDTEYSVVDPAVNSGFKNFDYRNQDKMMNSCLKHMVSTLLRLRIKQVQAR